MLPADADRLARFPREAEVLAALNHPNIAAIHGRAQPADETPRAGRVVRTVDRHHYVPRRQLLQHAPIVAGEPLVYKNATSVATALGFHP